MTTEMTFNIPEQSCLNRLDRFTDKSIGIILDRHAPSTGGKLTKDSMGEYIRLKDILVLLRMGGLVEFTSELKELLDDGAAQRGLMRDLSNLGYTDFDQVMTILKNNRHQLLEKRTFEIWTEGYQATGEHQKAVKHASVEAFSFHEAIEKYVKTLKPEQSKHWRYNKDTNTWLMWGCRAYDNETDAREAFG